MEGGWAGDGLCFEREGVGRSDSVCCMGVSVDSCQTRHGIEISDDWCPKLMHPLPQCTTGCCTVDRSGWCILIRALWHGRYMYMSSVGGWNVDICIGASLSAIRG